MPAQDLLIEPLESRQMLSAVTAASTTLNTTVTGYTPAEIRKAYGFDKTTFASGVTANGNGQTIAIVDAYNDPNITADLSVFDAEFGLAAPPSLKIVSQTGSTSSLPSEDAGWAGEISLDVEWAHAIAPGANILLVEANSDDTADLMAAVNYSRSISGVSVVSMSWGGSEFFSWGGGENASQTNYDPDFTTPSGHQGITFVAAAGDSGTQNGVEWPASSTNVLSIGGTSLTTSDTTGTYDTESGWSGTSGGYSQYEGEPSWQDAVQSTGARSTPDVSYDADPNTGFAVYDSIADDGYAGWQEVGGTSAGAPQWAALVAIADQGRVLTGLGTLDGASQTLPELYSLYASPGSSNYDTYTSYFNDVTGGGGTFHWRFGGYGSSGGATAGYDTITGLGTPIANKIIDALVATTTTGTTGSGTNSGSGSGTSTTAALPASPLTVDMAGSVAASVIGGDQASLKVKVSNSQDTAFTGPITITLYASSDGAVSSDTTSLETITVNNLKLKSLGSKTYKLKYTYGTRLNGNYYLVADVDAVGTKTADATMASASTINVVPPTVDLGVAFASDDPISVTPGDSETITLYVTNDGNVTAAGTLGANLYAATGDTLDTASDAIVGTVASRKVKVKANGMQVVKLKVKFTAPADETAGTYNLIARIVSSTSPADSNAANNTALAATTA